MAIHREERKINTLDPVCLPLPNGMGKTTEKVPNSQALIKARQCSVLQASYFSNQAVQKSYLGEFI